MRQQNKALLKRACSTTYDVLWTENLNKEEAGGTPIETGRIVFIVYKDSFEMAVTRHVKADDIIAVLLTALESLLEPSVETMH